MNQPISVPQGVSSERVREDSRTLRKAIFRLGMPYLVRRLVVVAIGVAIYLVLANAILGFGEGVSYERLGAADSPVVAFLTRINIYIWWVLVVILGVIALFWLKSAWHNGVLRERAMPVPPAEIQVLANTLSAPVLDVMRWVWTDHGDPFSLGDLQSTLAETRGGRIEKIRIAIEQQAVLGAHRPI